MSDLIIHHIKVSYDESDERVRSFIKHLQGDKGRDDLEKYYQEALEQKDGKLHVEDTAGNEFTFHCRSGHICSVRLRGMEKI